MFSLTKLRLEEINFKDDMANPAMGAYVAFEGIVRNHNDGQTVMTLEYEAYEPLAQSEGERIIAEARRRFDIIDACCVHRTGLMKIGEMAVWVGVSAAHRGEAFRACEYIIDEIKHRLPIWKKETYLDGGSDWVNCRHDHASQGQASDETAFYARQLRLPDVGETGQQKLRQAAILVVGAGGLGSPVLQYLAAAGVGTLGICEPDRVEVSNLHRQVLYSTLDVAQPKAEAAVRHLRQLNPFIEIRPHAGALTPENAEALLAPYDLIVDCTDNFETRFLLNDQAVAMRKPLVQAAIYQYEGQILAYVPGEDSACLRCQWPQAPGAGDMAACAETGVLGATAGFFGSLQAMEALKLILDLPGRLTGRELLLCDLLHHRMQRIARTRNPECPVCGAGEKPARAEENPGIEIDLEKVPTERLRAFTLINLCEPNETGGWPLYLIARSIPYSEFLERTPVLDPGQQYLLFCPYGGKSLYLAKQLRRQGQGNVYSLRGGLPALEQFLARQEENSAPDEDLLAADVF